MSFFLPQNYIEQNNFSPEVKYFDEMICQPDVYRLAYHILQVGRLKYIVDIGSGNGDKLVGFRGVKLYCVDIPENKKLIEEKLPNATFIPIDLNANALSIPDDILKDAVVICSDVIEHLSYPDKLATDLIGFMKVARFVLVSTPDRVRLRGLLHMGPPDNRAHIREWSAQEFYSFIKAADENNNFMIGFTLDNDLCREHNNIIVLGGVDIPNVNCINSDHVKVKCFVEYVNDSIILPRIMHFYKYLKFDCQFMVRESLKVDFIANVGDANVGDANVDYVIIGDDVEINEKFVLDMPSSSGYEWVAFHQSNAIMISPWHDVSLPQALSWIKKRGYDRVSFSAFNFYQEFDNELRLFSEKEIGMDSVSWIISPADKSSSPKTYPLNFVMKKYFPVKLSDTHSNQIQWKIMTIFHELFVERLTGSYLL